MLQQLRTNSKYILWIVVVGIVVWFGSQGFTALAKQLRGETRGPERGMIGRVDDTPIRYQDFSDAYRQRAAQYAERTGGAEITDSTAEALREETWNALLADILINNELERLGIDVSNQQVFDLLWNNPPEYVYRSPSFQTEDGRFDFDAYHREIQLHPERWESVAQMYRESLRRQMLVPARLMVPYTPTPGRSPPAHAPHPVGQMAPRDIAQCRQRRYWKTGASVHRQNQTPSHRSQTR